MTENTQIPSEWSTNKTYRRLSVNEGKRGGDFCPICSNHDRRYDLTVNKADMALIEAAPDLLVALQELVWAHTTMLHMACKSIIELGGDCHSPDIMIASSPEIIKAKKAITSAKGQT